MSIDLAVIESRWARESNKSIKPIFDLIIQGLLFNEFDAIPYERFIGTNGLIETIDYFNSNKNISTIYIGCHGDKNNLCMGKNERMNARDIIGVIKERTYAKGGDPIRGLFAGACYFGTKSNANILLGDDSPLMWFAGYKDSVDWGRSTLLDGFFMMEYVRIWLEIDMHTHIKRNIVLLACRNIRKYNSGLVSELKFSFYLKRRNNDREIIDLMAISDEDLSSLIFHGVQNVG